MLMGAEEGNPLPDALREAHRIVEAQLDLIRPIAERTRSETDRLSATIRQIDRQLDELIIQQRVAIQQRRPAGTELTQRIGDLRNQHRNLTNALDIERHSLRQLDQLIRQIAMSSDALAGPQSADDPWAMALRAQVIYGREEERTRLAREVHDGPAQVLANSLMVLETCYTLAQQGNDRDKLLMMMDRLRGATRDGMQEVRQFIADLRPGIVRERGLGEAIREYIRSYTANHNIPVTVDIEPIMRLPEDVELIAYRIVQEALQNTVKYAQGAPLAVYLQRQADQVTLIIRDEGPGFDPYEVARRAGRSNWGLTSMRERAELIGAQFRVASRPGHGTEVTLTIPVK